MCTGTLVYMHMYAPTHERTYARTPARPHACTQVCTYARTHTRTYARTHVRTHIRIRACVHAFTRSCVKTCMRAYIYYAKHAYMRTYTHSRAYACVGLTRPFTHMCGVHTCTNTHSNTYTCVHTQLYIRRKIIACKYRAKLIIIVISRVSSCRTFSKYVIMLNLTM